MPKLKTKPIDSFKDYVAYVEGRRAKGPALLWYRGCGKTIHKLTPSLYRHNDSSSIEELIQLENGLIARFKQRSIPFHDRSISGEWEWLFFMQHFGVPTRLLDWTESPLMALFFAVTSAQQKLGTRGKPVFSNDAAIWVLDPIKWNKRSVDLKSFKGKVLTTDDPNASAYSPVGD